MRKYIVIAVAAMTVLSGSIVYAQMTGGGGMMGPGMVNAPWNYIPPGDAQPMSIEEAAGQVEKYLDSWGNPDLKLAEVMEFSNHFYAEIEEESTGVHAFELLVNKYTGQVFSEPGPNMMWNLKYGHMGGGMMGGPWRRGSSRYRRQDPAEPMKVRPETAVEKAQKYLDSLYPGLKAGKAEDRFYGYYTLHTLKDGKVYGMLSVNGYTGDVWYHIWHGRFVGMKEMEEGKRM